MGQVRVSHMIGMILSYEERQEAAEGA